MCYTGLQANVIGGNKARDKFNKNTNFADGWIYSSGFDAQQAEKVKSISGVNDVQLRTEVPGKADEKYNSAEMAVLPFCGGMEAQYRG